MTAIPATSLEIIRQRMLAGVSSRKIAAELGLSQHGVYSAAKRLGLEWKTANGCVPVVKPIPDDFRDYAGVESQTQLMARYCENSTVIVAWRRIVGLYASNAKRNNARLALPADFAQVQAGLPTKRAIQQHYSVDRRIVDRWFRQAGIVRVFARFGTQRKSATPVSAPAKRTKVARLPVPHTVKDAIVRDTSRAGQAADYLRKFSPVTRCDENGRFDPAGTHWRRGSSVLSAADVIERAEYLQRREAA